MSVFPDELANLKKWHQQSLISSMHAQDDRNMWIIPVKVEPVLLVFQTFRADFIWDEWKYICLTGSEWEIIDYNGGFSLMRQGCVVRNSHLLHNLATHKVMLDSWGLSHMWWLIKINLFLS
jgi:hypothetical protein